MSLTSTLPTDKKGNVYHGVKTLEQAKQAIADAPGGREELPKLVAELSEQLIAAGYTGVAARLRAHYA